MPEDTVKKKEKDVEKDVVESAPAKPKEGSTEVPVQKVQAESAMVKIRANRDITARVGSRTVILKKDQDIVVPRHVYAVLKMSYGDQVILIR